MGDITHVNGPIVSYYGDKLLTLFNVQQEPCFWFTNLELEGGMLVRGRRRYIVPICVSGKNKLARRWLMSALVHSMKLGGSVGKHRFPTDCRVALRKLAKVCRPYTFNPNFIVHNRQADAAFKLPSHSNCRSHRVIDQHPTAVLLTARKLA